MVKTNLKHKIIHIYGFYNIHPLNIKHANRNMWCNYFDNTIDITIPCIIKTPLSHRYFGTSQTNVRRQGLFYLVH